MAVITTTIALGRWNNRTTLNYRPVNEPLANGKRCNAFGVPIAAAGDPAETRRPYKIEEDGAVTYIMYDDDAKTDVAIYRIVEV